MQFDLIEFNRIRYGRGKEAARVRVWDGELTHLLWMSGQDIKANVIEHGPHLGLVLAAMEYGVHPSVSIGWYRETGKPFLVKQEPQRDKDGYWTHPDLLCGDENPDATFVAWLKRLGFVCKITTLESDSSPEAEAVQARYDTGDHDVLAWEPKPPASDGWCDGWWLASIHDTEEGIVALWLCNLREGAANDSTD